MYFARVLHGEHGHWETADSRNDNSSRWLKTGNLEASLGRLVPWDEREKSGFQNSLQQGRLESGTAQEGVTLVWCELGCGCVCVCVCESTGVYVVHTISRSCVGL